MERQQVQSSNLASVGYDSSTATLEIAFLNGGVYQYYGVPEEVYRDLMSAGSHGSYFDQHVKKAGYSYAKVG